MHIELKRNDKERYCDNCNLEIQVEAVMGRIELSHCKGNFTLCEDCFNDMQNDMADEYCRFVDMGK